MYNMQYKVMDKRKVIIYKEKLTSEVITETEYFKEQISKKTN